MTKAVKNKILMDRKKLKRPLSPVIFHRIGPKWMLRGLIFGHASKKSFVGE